MERRRDLGICLRESDWSETSQIVTILTREHGVVRGLGKGARRGGGAFSDGFELLSLGELLWIPRPASQLATLTSWSVERTFRSASASWGAFVGQMYVAQVVAAVMGEGDPHPRTFDRVRESLESPTDPLRDLLRTQWVVLEDVGTALELDADIVSGGTLPEDQALRFLPHRGGFTGISGGTEVSFGVRASTVACLRRARAGTLREESPPVLGRGIRLLHEAIRTILGRELGSWAGVESWIGGGR